MFGSKKRSPREASERRSQSSEKPKDDRATAEPENDEEEPLFRPEVFEARKTEWLGTVLLAPKVSYRVFSSFAWLTTAAIVGMLFFAEYTRSQTVSGWLVPDLGVVRVLAPQAGVVSGLHVDEGDTVSNGTALTTLGTSVSSAAGNTNSEVISEITARRESILAERSLLEQELESRARVFESQIEVLKAEQQDIRDEVAFQERRVKLAADMAERQRTLFSQKLVARDSVHAAEMSYLDQQSLLQSFERQITAINRQIIELEAEAVLLPMTIARQEADMTRRISALGQDLAIAESEREIIVQAAAAGTVAAIHADQGSSVDPYASLVSIIPDGSVLVAELFVPSAAVGFIREGQRVLLKYRAFPYQKFGQQEGVVQTVSKSSLNPAELGARVAGMSSMLPPGEAVYVVTVALEKATVNAYGDTIDLQPGMQLEADIQVERRRLFEWVLDPLYTITGRGV